MFYNQLTRKETDKKEITKKEIDKKEISKKTAGIPKGVYGYCS